MNNYNKYNDGSVEGIKKQMEKLEKQLDLAKKYEISTKRLCLS